MDHDSPRLDALVIFPEFALFDYLSGEMLTENTKRRFCFHGVTFVPL